MRQFIDIITINEARRPRMHSAPPVNTAGFADDITSVMRQFAATPFNLRFQQTWTNQVRKTVADRKAMLMDRHAHDIEKWGDEVGPFEFDVAEHLAAAADDLWQHSAAQLLQVKHNVEYEEQEYQQRAAERHHREDDPDFYIESSDYLSGMTAMVECARDLSTTRQLGNPHDVQAMLAILKRFIADWSDHDIPTDGGEAPILDEDFVNVIECLLPLMLLLYTR